MSRFLITISFILFFTSLSAQHFNGDKGLMDDFMSKKTLYYERTGINEVDEVIEKFVIDDWQGKELKVDSWANIEYDEENPKYILRFSKIIIGEENSRGWFDYGNSLFIQKVIKDSKKGKSQSGYTGLMGRIGAVAYLPFNNIDGEFRGVLIENCIKALKHGIDHRFEYVGSNSPTQKYKIQRKDLSVLAADVTLLIREDQIKENVTEEALAKIFDVKFKIVSQEEWTDCITNKKENHWYLDFAPQYQKGEDYEKLAKYDKKLCFNECSYRVEAFITDCATGHIMYSNYLTNESRKKSVPQFSSVGLKKINKVLTK